MAAKSNLRNMALCLTLVCLVCGGLLGGVNAITEDIIAETAHKNLVASIAAVLPQGGELSESMASDAAGIGEYYVLSQDGAPVAYAVKTTTNGFGGALTLMVGVLPDGTVYNTSVLEHSETPGLGAKCTEEESFFRTQFKGFRGRLAVKKDGGDLDAITASTITSRAFTLAVKQAVDLVSSLNGGQANE
ncbi:MAG: RnfABCDGE type electron transport complex subunit G [Bacteroidales bacterium]|nr:RnfABCDGE type electron transport complex subunit G [Bacteroidales bacterium]